MRELMNQSRMLTADAGVLYPDLIAHGSLVGALHSALIEIGSSLTASGLSMFAGAIARVEMGPRCSQVYIAANERLFVFDFWNRGVVLAGGQTADLHETARAIGMWVGSECSTSDLSAEFACVKARLEAAGYEQGEELEQRWRQYRLCEGAVHGHSLRTKSASGPSARIGPPSALGSAIRTLRGRTPRIPNDLR